MPGAVDSLFSVEYPGFIMEIRTPTGARDMATHVEVEESRQLLHRLLSNRIATYTSLDALPLLSQQEVFLSLGNTAQLKKVRRDIARVKTVMNSKEAK